ncbi:MAG: 30S ribosomal protein S7 [Candidatus Thermoplasmatota archaeon]|jgi:small subunit ribosomal protein S7|nr:30S ribosomal protein S7 [Candidatus Thermoplasmatota archaeon]MCL5681379.1 30S ribosomal protein S7 [Candidatus Thermoplasmatota archaeon]
MASILIFEKWETAGITVQDQGLVKYISLKPTATLHSGGRYANKFMGKATMNIVERLINNLMRTVRWTGKKQSAYRTVKEAFEEIERRTKENPVQVFVNAVQNSGPREEITRLKYGGIAVPKSVDTSSSRRLDLAIRNISAGARETAKKSKKNMYVALADEIIAAAKNDPNCHSIKDKEDTERQAASAR